MTRFIIPLSLFLLAALCNSTRAGISAPNSSFAFSADGKHILIMRSAAPDDDNTPQITFPDGHSFLIRNHFAKSGVYDATTLAPEWQVDWFSLQWDLLWSPDFRYVVRRNRLALSGGWAIAFYDGGKLIQSYDCPFLLPHLRHPSFLPFSTWDWHSRWYETFDLNPTQNRVILTTPRRHLNLGGHTIDLGLQDHYEFNIADGAVLASYKSGVWLPCIYLLLIGTSPIAIAWAASSLYKRFIRLRHRRGFPAQTT